MPHLSSEGGEKVSKKMLDLFSGLGGASESMLNNGWEVKRIENNPELTFIPNTTIDCVKNINQTIKNYIQNGHQPLAPTLIWASPPCLEFSTGFSAPRPKAQRAGIPFEPDLSLMLAAKEIIDNVGPKYWVIENVRGAIKDFRPHLGEPQMIVGPYVLWGNFPKFSVDENSFPTKAEKDTWSNDPLRANKKALVPYVLSDALRSAIESQRTLDYWF